MDEGQNSENATRKKPLVVEPIALETEVLCEQVRILYQNPLVLLINPINAILAGYVLRNLYPGWLIVAWIGSFVVVISARLYNSWRYQRIPQPAETVQSWAWRFTVGATATGCLWGLTGSVVTLTADPAYHAFIAFLLGGMIASAVIVDSAHLPAMIGFAAPTVLPTIMAFLAGPNSMSVTMGLMSAAFAAALWVLGRRANRWIASIARRGIVQAALTADLEKEIIERKRTEEEIIRVMHTDLLTGLPNRTAFLELLAKEFAAARSGGKPFAILYLDLDRFKDVNETLGHPFGDELLKAVARRIGYALRNAFSIARVGGDEFGIFVTDFESCDVIVELASKIVSSMAEPYIVGGSELHVSASIGLSVYRVEMSKPEEMMREADLALYEAKASGSNQYRFHSATNDLAVRERVKLVEELHAALERGEFEVYYQPQVEAPSGRIIGLEALVRWNHPRRGLVFPGSFIPVAEKIGSIVPLGQWVLSDVCRQLQMWQYEGIRPAITAINVSAVQLLSPYEFERNLMKELGTRGLDPGMIELELTESVLMESTRGHSDTLDRLRALGVRIAIDDFGTGYSSLEYLRAFGAHRIKIAQQFVCDLPDDQSCAAIVRATIALAREFGIEIFAEGVETAEQRDFLVQSGCYHVQGFYFSRAVPAEQAAKLLRQGVLSPAPAHIGTAQAADMEQRIRKLPQAQPAGART